MNPTLIRRLFPRVMRNALRSPSKTFARSLAKLRFTLGCAEEIAIRPDWTVRCHPLCLPEFGVFIGDPAQKSELDDFVKHCTPRMKLLDAGAHWGFFSLAALHFGGEAAQALAVEASPAARRILEINLRLNNAARRGEAVQVAVGESDGTLSMLTTGAGGADYFVLPQGSRTDTISVGQTRVSTLCGDRQFWPTHFKVDVEGLEEAVFRGAEAVVARCRPLIFLELHGDIIRQRQGDPHAVLQQLRACGYRCFQRDCEVSETELERRGYVARLVCRPD